VTPDETFIVVGEVIKTRGVGGDLLVRPLTTDIERFLSLKTLWVEKTGDRCLVVERAKVQGGFVLLKIQGIDSREDAKALNGLALTVPLSEVPPCPEGEHYIFELAGMKVRRTDGTELGIVSDVMETGSNIVYVVKSAQGKEILVPATRDAVEKLDYENREILVKPLPGLFDE